MVAQNKGKEPVELLHILRPTAPYVRHVMGGGTARYGATVLEAGDWGATVATSFCRRRKPGMWDVGCGVIAVAVGCNLWLLREK